AHLRHTSGRAVSLPMTRYFPSKCAVCGTPSAMCCGGAYGFNASLPAMLAVYRHCVPSTTVGERRFRVSLWQRPAITECLGGMNRQGAKVAKIVGMHPALLTPRSWRPWRLGGSLSSHRHPLAE